MADLLVHSDVYNFDGHHLQYSSTIINYNTNGAENVK